MGWLGLDCGMASIPSPDEKVALYQQAQQQLRAMLDGESDPILLMSSIVAVLHGMMPHYYWTGFYRVVGDALMIGPYQGTPACLHIAKGRGVCGAAWETQQTIVVEDVHAFPGHIACDARSESEIVVPWKNSAGDVVAVLDVDSTLLAAFDEVDSECLERILGNYGGL